MTAPLLEVRDLRKWFPVSRGGFRRAAAQVRAVDGVSFDVGEREVLGICGESGSGKTTIGRAVLRLVEPTGGSVRFAGEEVGALDAAGLRAFRRRAQIVFQDPYGALDPRMSIADILAEPLILQRLEPTRARRRARAAELLEMVSLSPEHLDRRPHELSGGQRQRVVIARALAVGPRFVVADEPVSALDVSIQAQIVALLNDLKARLGLSMLFISHDLAVMEYLSDRIAVVYLGQVMEMGPADRICCEPHHPYTRALLSSVPGGGRQARRVPLEGELPDPTDPPTGCVFRTRCPHALPECAAARPPLRGIAPGHVSGCIRDDLAPFAPG